MTIQNNFGQSEIHQDKKVRFIIGSGRSGTRTFYKMLAGHENVEIHHEYLCTHVQPLGVLNYLGLLPKEEIKNRLKQIYLSTITYSSKDMFIDSSNKLTWLISPLIEIFPNAKFVAITRDGRKVVSSFYYKLKDEIYDDKSSRILYEWYLNPNIIPMPPFEKKYWWNIPPKKHPLNGKFSKFSRFEKICYHWQESYKVILEQKQIYPSSIYLTSLEEITSSEDKLKCVFDFLEIDYDPIYYKFLQIPRNVFFPLNFKLTPKQEEIFWDICGDIMKKLGYERGSKQYDVKY